ncbi:MAG: VCBS repeat-containing protein, partial [Proteobacteria bacterium]
MESSTRFVSDLNRDGFTDFVALGKKGLTVAWGQLSGLSDSLETIPFTLPASWRAKDNPVMLGELNGDGYPDLILTINKGDDGQTGVWVALGNGRGFESGRFLTSDFGRGWSFTEDDISLHDLNLDGLSDIVGIDEAGVHVALSDGKGSFRLEEDQVPLFIKADGGGNSAWIGKKRPKYFVDVNGDNYPDILVFKDDGVFVAAGTGRSFGEFQKWSDEFAGPLASAGYLDNQRQIADVNADGLADLLIFQFNGVHVALNTGTQFSRSTLWLSALSGKEGWSERRALRTVFDWNKDGYSDFVGLDNEKGLVVYLGNGSAFPSDPSAHLISMKIPGFSNWQKDRRSLYLGDFDNN